MANPSPHVSDKETTIETPSLTSDQLEQWFANLERENNPSEKTNSDLSTEFVSRFGLKDPLEVIEFLKSADGKRALTMISEEIMKVESLNKNKEEQYLEEALQRQKHLIYLLMALIAKDKEHAKQVSEVIQQQIEHKLKDAKHIEEGKTEREIAIEVLTQNIHAYTMAIQALDEQLEETQRSLNDVEVILTELAEESAQMEEHHAVLNDHLDQVNEFYNFLHVLTQPVAQQAAHNNQQITSLTAQLATLRIQPAPQMRALTPALQQQIPESHSERKARMLQDRIDLHKVHNDRLKQEPLSNEQTILRLLSQARVRINEIQLTYANQPMPAYIAMELEGLKIQERGFTHALQVVRNEKILLNTKLEQVHDLRHAHFIIDPSHRPRYHMHGNSYAILPENVSHKQLTPEEWLQAKHSYDRQRPDVQLVNVHYAQQMKQQRNTINERVEFFESQKNNFIDRIEDMKASKVDLLHALSDSKTQKQLLSQNPQASPLMMSPKPVPVQASSKTKALSPEPSFTRTLTPTPKPKPKSSYALMMKSLECLVPRKAPAPHKEEIHKVSNAIKSIVPPERQGEFEQLIDEVQPGKVMPEKQRLGWLHKVTRLIPDVPPPELDSTFETPSKR